MNSVLLKSFAPPGVSSSEEINENEEYNNHKNIVPSTLTFCRILNISNEIESCLVKYFCWVHFTVLLKAHNSERSKPQNDIMS